MRYCTRCGALLTGSFCTVCGTPAPQPMPGPVGTPDEAGHTPPAEWLYRPQNAPAAPLDQTVQLPTAQPAAPPAEARFEYPPSPYPSASYPNTSYPPAASGPTGSSAPPGTGSGSAPGKKSRLGLWIMLVALVLIAGLAVGWFVIRPRFWPPAAATTPSATRPAGTAPATTVPATTAPVTTEPTPSASGFTCWSGDSATTLAECGDPQGLVGLRWVYPTLDLNSCDRIASKEVTVSYECQLGDKKVIRVRWWQQSAEARTHYTAKFKAGKGGDEVVAGQIIGTVYWDTKPVKGIYRLSGLIWNNYSFTVEARTAATRTALLHSLVVVDPTQFQGYDAATGRKAPIPLG